MSAKDPKPGIKICHYLAAGFRTGHLNFLDLSFLICKVIGLAWNDLLGNFSHSDLGVTALPTKGIEENGLSQLLELNVLNRQLTSVPTSFSCAFLYCKVVKLNTAFCSLAARVPGANEIPQLDTFAWDFEVGNAAETALVPFVAVGRECHGNASVQSQFYRAAGRYEGGEYHALCSRPSHYILLGVVEKPLW